MLYQSESQGGMRCNFSSFIHKRNPTRFEDFDCRLTRARSDLTPPTQEATRVNLGLTPIFSQHSALLSVDNFNPSLRLMSRLQSFYQPLIGELKHDMETNIHIAHQAPKNLAASFFSQDLFFPRWPSSYCVLVKISWNLVFSLLYYSLLKSML